MSWLLFDCVEDYTKAQTDSHKKDIFQTGETEMNSLFAAVTIVNIRSTQHFEIKTQVKTVACVCVETTFQKNPKKNFHKVIL